MNVAYQIRRAVRRYGAKPAAICGGETMLQRILKLDAADIPAMPKLRYFVYGASPMPAEVMRKAIARFGMRFVQIYGQSEAPVTLSILRKEDHDPDGADAGRLASAGMPFETVEMRIVDAAGKAVGAGEPGEVVLRAPQLMQGYWNRPEQTRDAVRDGWLHTKDLGRFDEHGYLYLLGRMDEMIISGGYNVAPREIEEALYLHPAIHECAVVGEPDEEWGSAVVAYVALRDAVGESEIADFARSRLGFKRPKRIYRVMELPKNPNGKIQKSALKPGPRPAMGGGAIMIEEISRRVASLSLDGLGEAARSRMALCLLANLAVGVAGVRHCVLSPPARGAGAYGLLSGGRAADARPAAFWNAAAMHARTQDDFHPVGNLHIGTVVIPALMAVADETELSGRAFLEALAAGYTVATGLSRSASPRTTPRGVRSTGLYAPFGATAAVAKARGYGHDTTAQRARAYHGIRGRHDAGRARRQRRMAALSGPCGRNRPVCLRTRCPGRSGRNPRP